MYLFDVRPNGEAMNPVFEPVMIRRDDEKNGDETGQRPVTFIVERQPIQADDTDRAGQEQPETPPRKGRAGLLSTLNQS